MGLINSQKNNKPRCVIPILILAICVFSCNSNNTSADKHETPTVQDLTNPPLELQYNTVDKTNIEVVGNQAIHQTHHFKIYKPSDWKVITGTSQYTALKIAHTEYGAQVSINLKEPSNHTIDDEYLNTEIEEFKTGLKNAGIELQNVIQQNITYGNDNARRIDGTWLKSVGNIDYIEKVTLITIIHEGKMITIGCSYPEKLLHLFSENLDKIINSLEFIEN
jgi:hypothetical protein